jgi:hypothetical protein
VAERIGWIGSTRREAIRQRIAAVAATWWREWSCVADGVVTVTLDAMDTHPGACAIDDAGSVAIENAAGNTLLAGALTATCSDQGNPLARFVGDAAIGDLLAMLAGQSGLEPGSAVLDVTAHAALCNEKYGATGFVLSVGPLQLRIRLSRTAADRWAPSPGTSSAPLETRQDAASDALARLAATLDLGDIALSELGGLRAGDVLVTQARLDTAPRLSLIDGTGEFVARGHLGEREGRRALRLVSP